MCYFHYELTLSVCVWFGDDRVIRYTGADDITGDAGDA